ncbi:alpha/beta hydrolase [Burkholderia alba]|uniref:alpha/beta hydrolase n=1 Tax=Burkholderia alba TaxID=2683677 RepID=UPI002B058722|nr:alpha/beta hydrolase [Burkholderia alba]
MTALYRGMDRAALDAAYNNVAADPDFASTLARFRARSAALYAAHPVERDLAYGASPRERFDWLPCGLAAAPTFVFLHGGYWQHCDKEDFAFVASGPLARGFNVVLAEYTLAPHATMTRIVAEIGRLLDHLAADPARLGTAARPLCLSGHSAGGHLSALHRAHPAVAWALPISALVDLEPISLSWLDDTLGLSADEIARYSPIRAIGPGAPTTVAVGAAELPELVRQSADYATACADAGEPAHYLPVAGLTHFSVLDDLADPAGALMSALARMVSVPLR